MALKPVTARMDTMVHDIIARAANEVGTSVSKYLEIAGLVRAVVQEAEHHPENVRGHAGLYDIAERLLRDHGSAPGDDGGGPERP